MWTKSIAYRKGMITVTLEHDQRMQFRATIDNVDTGEFRTVHAPLKVMSNKDGLLWVAGLCNKM